MKKTKTEDTSVALFPCGMRFALRKTQSQVAYCALTIQSGTRNETAGYAGLAHLTEHMLFKGTAKRSATEINNRLERLGGELNAYTAKEETVVYSTVLKEDVKKAVDLMLEIVFTSTFSEKELEKEKQVVAEEINIYKDSPSEYIFDDFEQFLFEGSTLSRQILGTTATLRKITSAVMKEYVHNNFTPDRMSLTIVGDFEWEPLLKRMSKIVAAYVGDVKSNPAPLPEGASELPLQENALFSKDISRKNHQVNCIVGASAYSSYDIRRPAFLLLLNILGGPSSNSRLNSELRERRALVYNVEASCAQYSDVGVVTIYFGCEKKHLDNCLSIIQKELEKLRTTPLSPASLKAAKKQLLAQNAVSSDNGEMQALALGKNLMTFGYIQSDSSLREKVEAVTAEQIKNVACEIFAPERLSTLIYR